MKKLYTLCLSLMIGSTTLFAQVDVGVTAISAPTNGSDIEDGAPTVFVFDVTNFGATLSTGDTLFFGVNAFGGNPVPLFYPLPNDMMMNDVLNLQTPPLNVTGPLGPFDVCAWTDQPGDIDNSNDTTCNNYTLIPPPVGIRDNGAQLNNVFYSNEQLTVNMTGYSINSDVTLTVTSITGQIVKNEKLTISNSQTNVTVPMAGLSKGIYIVSLQSERRLIQTQKIMVH